METPYVKLAVSENIAHLELVRVGAKNALDRTMVDHLAEAVEKVAADTSIKGLMISGQGTCFSVGGDLRFFARHIETLQGELEYMINRWHTTLLRLYHLRIPVVVGVHGAAAGGTLGMVWAADHIIFAGDTKIALGFADLGVTGDGGNSWFLPQIIGMRRAKELMLEGRIIDAETALEWGLVNQVVQADDLLFALEQKVTFLSRRLAVSFSGIKRNLMESKGHALEEHLNVEKARMLQCVAQEQVKNEIQTRANAVIKTP